MAEKISRTGRVQSWIDDPDGRLPVSCTVFVVDDSMEGPEGIEASWRFASHALGMGQGVQSIYLVSDPRDTREAKGCCKWSCIIREDLFYFE